MTQLELKSNVHSLIDEIDDPKLLSYLYEFMLKLKVNAEDSDDNWWDNLTEEQRNGIDIAIEQTKDTSKHIPHDQVIRESRNWLKKK